MKDFNPTADRTGRNRYQWGDWTLDLHSGFLYRGTEEVKLRPKSFEVLTYLVEHAGHLVTKDELLQSVWPGSYVTDNSLSQCIIDIRRALSDETQQVIRTIARRGYLFDAPLTESALPGIPVSALTNAEPTAASTQAGVSSNADVRSGSRRLPMIIFVAALFVLAVGFFGYDRGSGPAVSDSEWTKLTDIDSAIHPALSPDGRMLAFIRGNSVFYGPGELFVKMLPDGQPKQLTHDGLPKVYPVFTPDGTRIAYTAMDPKWDTWTIPVLGGEPQRFMANASGLSWIDENRVLFSEFKSGFHLGIVMAAENRTDRRELYFPPNERDMAHRSAMSPDRKWVAVAEMAGNGGWIQCRVIPFPATSEGKQVGPEGRCIDAAWSSDGQWLYLNVAEPGGSHHIWRQRFPHGTAEQVTSGPTEQSGIWMTPDGKSLLTSVGLHNSEVWIHDASGERQAMVEGAAYLPTVTIRAGQVFAPDGKKVYFLVRLRNRPFAQPELWAANVSTGATQSVLPGITVTEYDIAPDGKQVVYVSPDLTGKSHVWIASLDRSVPPKQIDAMESDNPCFADNGTVYFRRVEGTANFLYRVSDEQAPEKVSSDSVLALGGCSPDGKWLFVVNPNSPSIYSTDGKRSITVCDCWIMWSRDGKYMYITTSAFGGAAPTQKTFAIRNRRGESMPLLPRDGITAANILSMSVAAVYDTPSFHHGPDPTTYAFVKRSTQRNIYSVPIAKRE